MSELIIPKGTLIHVGGFPFELLRETKVIGRKENMDIAMKSAHPDAWKRDGLVQFKSDDAELT